MTLPPPNRCPSITQQSAYRSFPAFSPDLNPIEHLWDELDRRVRRRDNPPSSVPELEQALLQEWNNIPQMTVNSSR
jgi:transposase